MEDIKVTPRMIDAGLEELRDHNFMECPRHLMECVYRAMVYADLEEQILPATTLHDILKAALKTKQKKEEQIGD